MRGRPMCRYLCACQLASICVRVCASLGVCLRLVCLSVHVSVCGFVLTCVCVSVHTPVRLASGVWGVNGARLWLVAAATPAFVQLKAPGQWALVGKAHVGTSWRPGGAELATGRSNVTQCL